MLPIRGKIQGKRGGQRLGGSSINKLSFIFIFKINYNYNYKSA